MKPHLHLFKCCLLIAPRAFLKPVGNNIVLGRIRQKQIKLRLLWLASHIPTDATNLNRDTVPRLVLEILIVRGALRFTNELVGDRRWNQIYLVLDGSRALVQLSWNLISARHAYPLLEHADQLKELCHLVVRLKLKDIAERDQLLDSTAHWVLQKHF